ncbi:unnamed protein product [Adineta steineri]|uniref:Uncharacterized protein n=1 Tax=Adineta steineri TaxID=433720 RepID=A0A815F7F9_9BILA|nr:unnamed protein product [Adineta steineri]
MSLWVQRTSTGGGTLVHYSTQTNGKGWCIVPIGFSSAGNIIATVWAPQNQVTGPILSVNTWTHIATTYSQTYGLTVGLITTIAYWNGSYSFWPMENNAVDIISGLSGTGVNSPTYVTPGITNRYALKLIRNRNQYIKIPTFKSFAYTSFTVEMWIYPTTLYNGDYSGLFTQYDTSSTDHSLQMMIQGLQLTINFGSDGVTGATSLTTNTWYHAAFVYDYPSRKKTVYLNGYQDASVSSAGPYLGMSGSINIGMYQSSGGYHYFDG